MLTMIVPTRGRPHVMMDLIDAVASTRTDSHLWIGVDDDDEKLTEYRAVLHDAPEWVRWWSIPTRGMVRGLNLLALRAVDERRGIEAIGFMGDDHRPRTVGWDHLFEDELDSMNGGIVYGNDLLQGVNLPTHVVMSKRIIRALGHMGPRQLTHLYLDNYWKALGEGIGRLSYMPHVIVEHMHPIAGKSEWDDGYRRVNDGALYEADRIASEKYAANGFMDHDIKAVRSVL